MFLFFVSCVSLQKVFKVYEKKKTLFVKFVGLR